MKDADTHSTTSTSDPTPIVKFAAELGDQVGGVLWVRGLDQMVIVVVSNFLRHTASLMLMADGGLRSRLLG
jgi:hypothetical protein